MKKDTFTIRQTTDPEDFAVCAKMMSLTDPWITLDMDYEQCLKAFEGDFKEIYLLEIRKRDCRFCNNPNMRDFLGIYPDDLCWR